MGATRERHVMSELALELYEYLTQDNSNLVSMKTYTTHASSATGTCDPCVPAAKELRLHRPRVQRDRLNWRARVGTNKISARVVKPSTILGCRQERLRTTDIVTSLCFYGPQQAKAGTS
jgi:hypothetical protein